MGPNTCPACEHVCCILGPLSLNVTLGGHPWVPDSGLTRLISTPPPIHTPLEELALSRPLPPGSPLPAAASRGECRALPRQAVQTRAPASLCAGAGGEPRLGPRSSARPETARPSPRLLALGGPPDCPSGLRLWPAGPGKLLHGPQHRKSTHHLIRPGAGAQRAGALPAAPPHPSPARAPGVTQLAPPHPPTPGKQRARAQSPPGRRRSGEAAACAVDPAGGAHCGDGPRDAPDSHLLLLLPPLPAGLPVAWDHLRYVLE